MSDPAEFVQDVNVSVPSDRCTEKVDQAGTALPIVVTLIHGTSAKDTHWLKDGSTLRREVAAELGGHERNTEFDVFSWSGRNSHKARRKAGYELADHIRALRDRGVPANRHFIVAHSHGGNVALFAHKHLDENEHVLGIATLGTPFLHAQRRDERSASSSRNYELKNTPASEHVTAFVMLFSFLALMVTLPPVLQGHTKYPVGWAFVLANAIPMLVRRPFQINLSPYVYWLWRVLNGERAAARLIDAVAFPWLERTHILSFVYPRDEAGLLLGTLALTTKGPTWLMDKIVIFGVLSSAVLVPLGLAIGWSAAFYSGVTGVDMEPYVDKFIGVFAIGAAALLAIWVLLAALRYLFGYLRGHPGGFGWERPSIHNWADVGTTAKANVPHARSNHVEVVDYNNESGRKALRHSMLYEDRRILKALAYWMVHVR